MRTLLSFSLPTLNGDGTGSTQISAPGGIPTGGLNGGAGSKILTNGVFIIIMLAVVLCLFYLIWGGIQWTMSGGDKNKVQTARNKIMYAIIGLLVIFLSFFIVGVVGRVFGVTIFPK